MTAYDTSGNNPIPVTASQIPDSRAISPERNTHEPTTTEIHNSNSTCASPDKETRKVINMMCNVKPKETNGETEFTVCCLLLNIKMCV